MTSWHNDDPPGEVSSRVREARVSASAVRASRRDRRASTSCSAARSACARSRCCGCWPGRSCSCTCGRSSPTPGRADLPRRLPRALRRVVSGAARGRLRRAALAGGGRPRSRCRSAAHPPGDGDDVRDRHLQPLPLDHALPQQPRLPGDRARAAGGGAVRPRAVARRVAAPPARRPALGRRRRPGRCGCCGSSARRSTGPRA